MKVILEETWVIRDLSVALSASTFKYDATFIDDAAVDIVAAGADNDDGDDNDAAMNGAATATAEDEVTTTGGNRFSGTLGWL